MGNTTRNTARFRPLPKAEYAVFQWYSAQVMPPSSHLPGVLGVEPHKTPGMLYCLVLSLATTCDSL